MDVSERELVAAWSGWLGDSAWSHVGHLTTRASFSRRALEAEMQDRFIRRLAWFAGHRLAWFAAVEETHAGRLHLHVLLGGTAQLSTRRIAAAWKAGNTRITKLRNDPSAAIEYVVKELGRFPDNYNLSRRWIRAA